MPGMTPPVDGPPPSPATNPAAAREAGQPMPNQAPGGGGAAGLANPISMQQQGPDLSGILKMGEMIEQGMLSIAQSVPQIADEMGQAKAIFMAALGKFVSTSGQSNGSMPGAAARGQVVTQAGSQFPGGGQGSGRPF